MTLFLLLLALFNSVATAADCPPLTERFDSIQAMSEKLPEILGPTFIKNVPEFCQINGYRDYKETKGYSIWHNDLVASFDYREAQFLSLFYLAHNSNESKDSKFKTKVDEWAKQLPQEVKTNAYAEIKTIIGANPGRLSDKKKEIFNDQIGYVSKWGLQQKRDLDVGIEEASYICTDLTVVNTSACVKGVINSLKLVHPSEGVTNIYLFKEVANDPVYMTVFKRISLNIIDHLSNKTPPQSRLFDDFVTEFKNVVHDESIAREYAWKSMALFATGGADTYMRVDLATDSRNFFSEMSELLYVIGAGQLVMDRLSAQQGFLYTYPKGVDNLCDYGKNYHFWMTAYLAREAAKVTGNIQGSAAAAYSVQKGYQFAKVDGGRDPSAPFTQDTFSNYNNNIRLDLSLAAAGAWYGANSTNGGKSIAIDRSLMEKGIKTTFDGSKILPRRPKSKFFGLFGFTFSGLGNRAKMVEQYSDWKQIINPDAPFKYFQKGLGY